jgi:hypothetical protein
LKEKGNRHAQAKWIYPVRNKSNSESARVSCGTSNGVYVNRAFGGDFRHCAVDGDIAAVIAAGQKAGQGDCLSI